MNTTWAIKDETGSLHKVFPECLQDRHVTAAQIRQQLLTGSRNQIQQLICWELSNLISKLPTLDPLRSGMSHGEERGGESRPHFSAGTTKPCYIVVLVWGMTQVLFLRGAQITKNVVWSALWGREPPAALSQHWQAASWRTSMFSIEQIQLQSGLQSSSLLLLCINSRWAWSQPNQPWAALWMALIAQ